MDRRRLVDASGDGLEVADVEAERPQVAVPADQVERVVPVVVGRDSVGGSDLDDEVALVVVRRRPRRGHAGRAASRERARAAGRSRCDTAWAARSPTALRGTGCVGRIQRPGRAATWFRSAARGNRPARSGAARRSCRRRPSLVDEQHLVRDAVAVEGALRHRLRRADDTEHDVMVEVERDATGDHVAGRFDRARLRQSMPVQAVIGRLESDAATGLDAVRARRRRQVVEQGAATREAFDPEQLLGVERAIRRSMLRVALARDGAALDVVHGATGLLGSEDKSSGGRT